MSNYQEENSTPQNQDLSPQNMAQQIYEGRTTQSQQISDIFENSSGVKQMTEKQHKNQKQDKNQILFYQQENWEKQEENIFDKVILTEQNLNTQSSEKKILANQSQNSQTNKQSGEGRLNQDNQQQQNQNQKQFLRRNTRSITESQRGSVKLSNSISQAQFNMNKIENNIETEENQKTGQEKKYEIRKNSGSCKDICKIQMDYRNSKEYDKVQQLIKSDKKQKYSNILQNLKKKEKQKKERFVEFDSFIFENASSSNKKNQQETENLKDQKIKTENKENNLKSDIQSPNNKLKKKQVQTFLNPRVLNINDFQVKMSKSRQKFLKCYNQISKKDQSNKYFENQKMVKNLLLTQINMSGLANHKWKSFASKLRIQSAQPQCSEFKEYPLSPKTQEQIQEVKEKVAFNRDMKNRIQKVDEEDLQLKDALVMDTSQNLENYLKNIVDFEQNQKNIYDQQNEIYNEAIDYYKFKEKEQNEQQIEETFKQIENIRKHTYSYKPYSGKKKQQTILSQQNDKENLLLREKIDQELASKQLVLAPIFYEEKQKQRKQQLNDLQKQLRSISCYNSNHKSSTLNRQFNMSEFKNENQVDSQKILGSYNKKQDFQNKKTFLNKSQHLIQSQLKGKIMNQSTVFLSDAKQVQNNTEYRKNNQINNRSESCHKKNLGNYVESQQNLNNLKYMINNQQCQKQKQQKKISPFEIFNKKQQNQSESLKIFNNQKFKEKKQQQQIQQKQTSSYLNVIDQGGIPEQNVFVVTPVKIPQHNLSFHHYKVQEFEK
ncbi:hypothetical protein PPERSA_01251 [Pseudocohnilembus persalinus]|uniref:Uncharacterized protein n=1 Tax=Pseudocohnilembus persalinus TaxID=266149 RepID=A0A0V0QGS7_PSEPJ|nr:hypothetical protein PPERSA_01251 [Pseudocohnilembus persalinus]|eukprot:KRX01348.1 hypothetical protein PPERSA_01251 [Pseudocohnilembus persalinus]